ncbi:hypothetical protein CRG98_005723 [Punica granatum]|uniref:Disease resistance protein At4g27190-like leucine-rich repeats domain-containing protein n=1 Tax=Punica granatum TaxID=22663 RepID=A0A2I0KZU4_PUNGR|nr:hypothetical protein CRG98_005723 [Punica granatum]
MKNLESVCVKDCSILTRLSAPLSLDSDNKLKWMSLPELKEVILHRLPQLTHVVEGGSRSHRVLGFPSLTRVEVFRCERLMDMFPTATARTLSKLEEVSIEYCDSMREMIAKEESEGEGIDELTFPRLSSLKLYDLMNLICFSSASCSFDFPSLEGLSIRRCHKMEAFILPIAHPETAAFFNEKVELPKLVKLEIDRIGLKELLNTQIPPGSLRNLRQLVMFSCPKFQASTTNAAHRAKRAMKNQAGRMKTVSNIKFSHHYFGLRRFHSLAWRNWRFQALDKLKMICHGPVVPHAFSKLTEIKVEGCNKLEHVFKSDILQPFVNLEKLTISDCKSLSVIYDLQGLVVNPGMENAAITAQLEELNLSGLSGLKHIWNRDPTGIFSFQNLASVHVAGCESLTYLFPASLAESLLKLKNLTIQTSSQLEVVVAEDEVDKVSSKRILVFPQMTHLELVELWELKSFHSGRRISQFPMLRELTVDGAGHQVEVLASDFGSISAPPEKSSPVLQQPLFLVDKVSFPRLEELIISDMKNLVTIWCGQITGDCFRVLKEITVEGCDALVTCLFPPCMVRTLQKLEELEVNSCPSLEAIYDMRGLTQDSRDYSDHVVVGTQLRELRLSDLPKLEHIWNIADTGRIFISFHNLDSVYVEECASLKYIFPPSVAKALYNLDGLMIESCGVEEIVAAAAGQEGEIAAAAAGTAEFVFPRATYLMLSELPRLKSFCQRRHIFKWASLELLYIESCEGIQNLFCEIDLFQGPPGNGMGSPNSQQTALFLVDKAWARLIVINEGSAWVDKARQQIKLDSYRLEFARARLGSL